MGKRYKDKEGGYYFVMVSNSLEYTGNNDLVTFHSYACVCLSRDGYIVPVAVRDYNGMIQSDAKAALDAYALEHGLEEVKNAANR